jgi:hypothetical protein
MSAQEKMRGETKQQGKKRMNVWGKNSSSKLRTSAVLQWAAACELLRCVNPRFLEFSRHRKTENGVRAGGDNNRVADSENVGQSGS